MKMVKCTHSWELWDSIHTHFNRLTRARERQLRTELRSSKKGTKTIAEYLMRIQSIADALNSVGLPITQQEQVDVILAGLPEEYRSFVVTVNTRLDPYTLDEIESLLLTHESLLEVLSVPDTCPANVAYTPQGNQNNHEPQGQNAPVSTDSPKSSDSNQIQGPQQYYDSGQYNQYQANNSNNYRPQHQGGRGGGGRNRGKGGENGYRNHVSCTICGKNGHEANVCWHRFSYPAPQAPPQFAPPQFSSAPPQFAQP